MDIVEAISPHAHLNDRQPGVDYSTDDNNDPASKQQNYRAVKEEHIPAIQSALNRLDNAVGVNSIRVNQEQALNAIMKAEWEIGVIKRKLGLKE